MPRGLPDYYNPDTLVSQRLANVEEVVTVLRGIASLDNRGRTLFYDHFNEGLSGWLALADGDGVVAAALTAQALIPPASAFLDAGTSGGAGSSTIIKRFQLDASALLGFETSFLYTTNAPDLWLRILYNLAGNEFLAHLEVLPLTGVVRVNTPTGYENVGNVGYVAPALGPWLPLKLVGDFANGVYVRALVGQTQIDLSAYTLVSTAVAYPGQAEFAISCEAVNAITNDGYIGHATGTVDEP